MKKAITSHKADNENDKIKETLEPHEQKIADRLTKIEADIKVLEEDYAKCVAFFCENPKDSSEKFGEKIMKLFR